MGIVAGRAVERAATLRVATAPGKGRALKPDPELIGARQGQIPHDSYGTARRARSLPSAVARLGLTIARSRNLTSTALT